ncbi:MAG: SMP-30/gluconolactonase/LRE family protein [Caulobacteraceae bacterium]
MSRKPSSILVSGVCAAALLIAGGPVMAQPAGAPADLAKAPSCTPPPPAPPPAGGPPAFARNLPVTAIPGVVAAGASWKKIWQQASNSSDGLIPDKDGNVLMAQEDYDTVLRLTPDGKTSVAVANAKGHRLDLGRQPGPSPGRAPHRAARFDQARQGPDHECDPDPDPDAAGGRPGLGGRRGGRAAQRPRRRRRGGAWFTAVCLYYASPKGVTTVAQNLNTNGIDLNPDGKVLYVTNGATIVAFDVKGPGVLENRRDFAHLDAGGGGDGLAVDTEGRLYVSSGPGVQVFDKVGKYLGLIPTPRAVISITIAGPRHDTLFMAGSGADDENGQPIKVGPQQTAATVYSLPLLSHGLTGHAK